MATSIRVRNLPNSLSEIETEFFNEAKLGVAVKAKAVLQSIERETPVDTGAAQEGWGIDLLSFSLSRGLELPITITNSQDYIKLVNDGTSTRAPTRFVERAVMNHGTVVGSTFERD